MEDFIKLVENYKKFKKIKDDMNEYYVRVDKLDGRNIYMEKIK